MDENRTFGHCAKLGALRTLPHTPVAVAEEVAPCVGVISYPLHALWQAVVVLRKLLAAAEI